MLLPDPFYRGGSGHNEVYWYQDRDEEERAINNLGLGETVAKSSRTQTYNSKQRQRRAE